jgi:hypothetical protein
VAALFNASHPQPKPLILVQFPTKTSKKPAIAIKILICQEGLLQNFSEKCTTAQQKPAQSPKIEPCGLLSFSTMVVSTPIHF